MATRSFIIFPFEESDYRAIYCHMDGYPEGNGLILLEHYQEEGKIKELILGGDMSSLAEIIEDTDFYYPERDETLTIHSYSSKEEIFKDLHTSWFDIEYAYLWEGGQWLFYQNGRKGEFKPLSKKILEKKKKDLEEFSGVYRTLVLVEELKKNIYHNPMSSLYGKGGK